ncbi:MAG TPA: ABC transporter substrate-binding protein [Methylomirabilota bacterium]|jgi:peptide/nickel transport system substrate-binding protein|nr:ABC transporter substrate-binding protein [Methylomirabilota bacterium]
MNRLAAQNVLVLLVVSILLVTASGNATAQSPDGQVTIAFDASIAPTFLDPAETPGIGTPFVFLYALHDALVKPMPGNNMAPSLAESWKESPDGLVYEFKLREGLRFHNGDPFTAEDVKWSFQRYKGASAKLLHERVKAVEIVDPYRVRFVLHSPWPDFMVFYASPATGAAWIVPRKHIEKVGEEGFKRQPVGLGPYRFVRSNPGVELVLEANEQYWRKKPTIKRVVIKGVPDRTTRLAMLKTGEADIGYLMVGVEAATIKADPKLRLAKVIPPATWYVEFPEQWNPKSPWSDRRVRLAANLAIDKQALNEAERLGFSRLTGSIIPSAMDFALRIDPYPFDPTHAKRLLAEAGYPNGFDAGELTPLPPFTTMGEAVATYLGGVGIRTRVRSMERATFMEAWRGKKLGGVIVTVSAAPGNTAVRLETFVVSTAAYASGGYPDIDDLFRQQAQERDRKKRETVLNQIQRLVHERVMFAPIFEPATLHGVGPRMEEPAIGLNSQLYFAAPYEEMRLKKQ